MTWLSVLLTKAVAVAATITGKKFALMVASSLVATTGIVAAALTDRGEDLGPLAGLLSRPVASNEVPAEPEVEPEETAAESAGGSSPEPASGGEGSSSGSLPAPEPTPEEPVEEPEEEATTPEEPEPEAGQVQHVFVISLASPGYEAAFGTTPQMPYLVETLRPQGILLSNYTLLDDSPLANSIAAVSGQPPNKMTAADCPAYVNFPATARADDKGVVPGNGCIYPVETLSLADQLVGEQLRWKAYMESMVDETGAPDNCVTPPAEGAETPVRGGYSARLNPFAYFHSLLDLGDCSTSDVPLTELDKDLRKIDTTPNFAYISPNLCNAGVIGECPDGAPQGAAPADAFLSSLVPKILKSPAFKQDGLLVITFNQVSTPSVDPATGLAPPPAAEPLKVGTLLVSRFASPGAIDAAPHGPYSLLRSVEDLFRLNHLANASPAKVRSFASSLEGVNAGD